MEIIKATKKDTVTLSQLCLRSKQYWNYKDSEIAEWQEELTITIDHINSNNIYKLINHSNQILGFYYYVFETPFKVILDFFFIDKPYIGMGYGKLLLQDFLNRIKKTDATKIILESDPNAKHFYENFGFKIIGQKASSIANRFLPIMEYQL